MGRSRTCRKAGQLNSESLKQCKSLGDTAFGLSGFKAYVEMVRFSHRHDVPFLRVNSSKP